MKQVFPVLLNNYESAIRDSVLAIRDEIEYDELMKKYKDSSIAKDLLKNNWRHKFVIIGIDKFVDIIMSEWDAKDKEITGIPAGIILKPAELKALESNFELDLKVKNASGRKLNKLKL